VHIGVPLETHAGETRVAATPETVKKLVGQGHQVTVQAGAGISASIPDSAFEASLRTQAGFCLPSPTCGKGAGERELSEGQAALACGSNWRSQSTTVWR